jgi:hypothetical protein
VWTTVAALAVKNLPTFVLGRALVSHTDNKRERMDCLLRADGKVIDAFSTDEPPHATGTVVMQAFAPPATKIEWRCRGHASKKQPTHQVLDHIRMNAFRIGSVGISGPDAP